MAASSPNLQIIGEMIRDVVDPFVSVITMSMYFGTKKVINGCDLKAPVVVLPPRVSIGGQPNELYTLVMTDPDAPSPSNPTLRELVHWIVTNIPGGSTCAQGTEVMSYLGPCPQVGIHRYITVVYKQESRLEGLEGFATRTCFNTREYAKKLNLGDPVGIVYFNARR